MSMSDIEVLHITSHPTRLSILTLLGELPSYTSALSRTLKIERKVVAFHLSILMKYGLIRGEFALKPTRTKPTAVKVFQLTSKGIRILGKVKHALEE